MKTLTISSPHYDPGPGSVLVTDENLQSVSVDAQEFHTSLGDMSAANIMRFCKSMDSVKFVDYGFQRDKELLSSTTTLLNTLSHEFDIQGYPRTEPVNFTSHLVPRPPGDQVIWFFGCSLTSGTGLLDQERYSNLVEDSLGIPAVRIAVPGSSTRWSLRHLLHSDIQPNDLVVWQISTFFRESIKKYPDRDPVEVIVDEKNRELLSLYNFEQFWFNHMTLVDYGVKYLRARQQRFVLISIESQGFQEYRGRIRSELTKYPEYCYVPGFVVDLARDDLHPGIESNKILAQAILEKFAHGTS